MQRACHMPRDQDTRGQKGEEGVGGMPRIMLCKVYAGGVKKDGDRETEGQRPRGPGRGAREDKGGRAHKGQGWSREREQRGGAGRDGCLANCSARARAGQRAKEWRWRREVGGILITDLMHVVRPS